MKAATQAPTARRRATAKPAAAQRRKVPAPPRAVSPVLPPEVALEREAILTALASVVPMLGGLVGDHIEVVLHDLTRPESSILQIANGHITGRQVGSPVLGGPGNDKALALLSEGTLSADPSVHLPIYPYPTQARDGRALTSGTVIFRDSLGVAFASLCLNGDFNGIAAVQSVLARMLPRKDADESPAGPQAPEMEGLMREIIQAAVRGHDRPASRMSRDEKMAAVEMMLERGLFIVKGGVEKAASALGVTRFTIYNYLEAVKARRKSGAAAAR